MFITIINSDKKYILIFQSLKRSPTVSQPSTINLHDMSAQFSVNYKKRTNQ